MPETVAMKLTGHKTRSMFDRYNITTGEDLRAAAAGVRQCQAEGHEDGRAGAAVQEARVSAITKLALKLRVLTVDNRGGGTAMMSRTRRRILAAVVIGIALLSGRGARQVHAECVSLSVCYEFDHSSIVVLADVIEAAPVPEIVGNTLRYGNQVVWLRVIERFKGVPEDQREITATIDTRGETPNGLTLGRHLIYAYAPDKGGLWRIACSRTKPVTENDETGEVRQVRQCAAGR